MRAHDAGVVLMGDRGPLPLDRHDGVPRQLPGVPVSRERSSTGASLIASDSVTTRARRASGVRPSLRTSSYDEAAAAAAPYSSASRDRSGSATYWRPEEGL